MCKDFFTDKTMSTTEIQTKNEQTAVDRQARRELMIQQAKALDEAAEGAMDLFHGAETSTARELMVAGSINDLRLALTDDLMKPLMGLMNTDLGFRTDKDPTRAVDGKDKDGRPIVPYGVEVVRDVVIQAKMLGFRLVGNEVNIIAGRFYAAKNGYRRKLTDKKSFPGLTDFRDSYSSPEVIEGKGTIVKCEASWKRNGVPDSFSAEFGIRVNAGMGADAVIGKAERKLCKRVHDILLGMVTPDAEDLGDGRTIDAETTQVNRPVFSGQVPTDAKAANVQEPAKNADPKPAVTELKTLVEGMSGTVDQLKVICAKLPGAESWKTWADISEEDAQTMLRGRGKIVAGLTK